VSDECPPLTVRLEIRRTVEASWYPELLHADRAVPVERELIPAAEVLRMVGGVFGRLAGHLEDVFERMDFPAGLAMAHERLDALYGNG
jgi:hypothetical protein